MILCWYYQCVSACLCACVYPHTRIIIVLGLVQINDYRTSRDLGFDSCMVYLTRIWTIKYQTSFKHNCKFHFLTLILHNYVNYMQNYCFFCIISEKWTWTWPLTVMLTSNCKNTPKNGLLIIRLPKNVVSQAIVSPLVRKLCFLLAPAAILAAILDISNCSRISAWYPLDVRYRGLKDVIT